MSGLWASSLSEVLQHYRDGLTPGEYLESLVGRIAAVDPEIGAFIRFDAATARRELSAASSTPAGPLAGVPVAVKDNILAAGLPTTCGSSILGDFRAPLDATAMRRLRDRGAFVLGKTNLDEFAMGSSTEYSAWGVTRNPWDPTRVAGGSSGGSAAAVAARLAPVALGSDTGGSVRQPAAFCGIVGLKPTWGRVSRSGLVAFASSLDQIGILTRTAADCALMLGAIAGWDPADSTSSREPVPAYSETLGAGVRGLRLAVVAEATDELPDDVRADFDRTVRLLEAGGATVETVTLPILRTAIAAYYIVATAEASANLARFDGVRYGRRSAEVDDIRSLYFRTRGEGFGTEVKRRIMLGTFALSSGYHEAYYGRAQQVRQQVRRDLDQAFSRVDCLLTPTTPGAAFRVGEKLDDPLSMYLSDVFTTPANLAGVPAIAIPSGLSDAGLPLSIQVMGPHFSEETLLRIARYLEEETGFSDRMPPIGH